MNKMLRYYLDKLDTLSLRERVMVYAAATVVVVGLAQVLVFDTLVREKQVFAQVLADQRADMEDTKLQVEALQRKLAQDPDASTKNRLAEVKAELAVIEGQLRGAQADLIGPDKIVSVLEVVLQRNRQLKLVRLRTLPPETILLGTGQGEAGQPVDGSEQQRTAKPASSAEPVMFRHGIEIELLGNYANLHAYLAQLEAAPWRVHWGGVRLDASNYPEITMTLNLYTFSLDQTWLAL